MSDDAQVLLSLPKVLKQKICDYGTAKDVMALASTCSSIRNDLNVSVLKRPYELVYSQLYNGCSVNDNQEYPAPRVGISIPVFFATHCHSIRLTCEWSDQGLWSENGRIFIVSQRKDGVFLNKDTVIVNDQGQQGTIIWQSRGGPNRMDVTIRCNSLHNYYLWYQCHGLGHFLRVEDLQVRGVLIWDDERRTRRKTYERCMQLDADLERDDDDCQRDSNDALLYCTTDYDLPAFSFLGQLFSHCLDFVDLDFDDSSSTSFDQHPVRSFLESKETGIGATMNPSALTRLRTIAGIYLLLVGKDLSQCDHDVRTYGGRKAGTGNSRVVELPPILLRREVGWDATEDWNSPHATCVPCAVARIPVISGTESFRITGNWEEKSSRSPHRGGVSVSVFVVLTPNAAKERSNCESGIHYNGQPLGYGYHQTLQKSATLHFEQCFVVDPDAIGYYLCVAPRRSSREELSLVHVHLSMAIAEEEDHGSPNEIFQQFFGLLGAQEVQTTYECSFHLCLLRAVVSELLLVGLEPSRKCPSATNAVPSLLNLLSHHGFSSDTLGLECTVDLIDSILHNRRLPDRDPPNPTERGNLLFRTYAAM